MLEENKAEIADMGDKSSALNASLVVPKPSVPHGFLQAVWHCCTPLDVDVCFCGLSGPCGALSVV